MRWKFEWRAEYCLWITALAITIGLTYRQPAASAQEQWPLCVPDPLFKPSGPAAFVPPRLVITAASGHTQQEADERFALMRTQCALSVKKQPYNQERGYLDCVANDGFIRGYSVFVPSRSCRYVSLYDPEYVFR